MGPADIITIIRLILNSYWFRVLKQIQMNHLTLNLNVIPQSHEECYPFHCQKWPKSKFHKISKFHFVQFWKANVTMWKYCWRGFIWMVTPQDFVHKLKS